MPNEGVHGVVESVDPLSGLQKAPRELCDVGVNVRWRKRERRANSRSPCGPRLVNDLGGLSVEPDCSQVGSARYGPVETRATRRVQVEEHRRAQLTPFVKHRDVVAG